MTGFGGEVAKKQSQHFCFWVVGVVRLVSSRSSFRLVCSLLSVSKELFEYDHCCLSLLAKSQNAYRNRPLLGSFFIEEVVKVQIPFPLKTFLWIFGSFVRNNLVILTKFKVIFRSNALQCCSVNPFPFFGWWTNESVMTF